MPTINQLCAYGREQIKKKTKAPPYKDLGFAKVDLHRAARKGFPEVVYAKGKTCEQIEKISKRLLEEDQPLVVTKATQEHYLKLKSKFPKLRFNKKAGIICSKTKTDKKGFVLIITAGTSDIPVAEEARATLEVMGNRVKTIYDCGVAGIHRILDKTHILNKASAIIVIAGMEGALASVVGGLTKRPVIAVPTSVGYGASFKGLSALLTMLNCCAPGVAVVNIDNGFGAGYFASLINR